VLRSSFIRYFQGASIRWISVALLLAAASGAIAQKAPEMNARKAKPRSTIDLSLGIFGQLTPTRSPMETATDSLWTSIHQTTQGAPASAGVLGTFHQSFRPWLGYIVNMGYTRLNENYSSGAQYIAKPTNPPQYPSYSYFSGGSIGENVYEFTGSYFLQGPRAKHIHTFFQLGGGVLTFLPTQDPSPYWVLFRPVLVFGTGMNYRLSEHWALRAEYRGLFYRNPYYNGAASNVPMPEFNVVTSEPTISIVYRFGRKR
jgi:hypothetical protein